MHSGVISKVKRFGRATARRKQCHIAGYECQYYEVFGYYCDPADADSIREAIQSAWERYERDVELRKRLRSRISTEFTWQAAAAATLGAYQDTLC